MATESNFIKRIGNWISENWKYILILIVAFIFIALGAYLKAPEEIKKLIENFNFTPLIGSVLFYIGQIILVTMVLKFFLGMKPFKDAIYNIFKEIFITKDVINQCNSEEIYKIIQRISSNHNHIEFSDLSNKFKSINALKDEWKKSDTNKHIYRESFFTTTIYDNGQVILNRRIECEMMESGEFTMKHYFIPFDEDLNIEPYKNDTDLDRWNKKSFKKITEGLEDQDLQISVDVSNNHSDDKDWILFTFNCPHIDKGKKFIIEFSISDKIPKEHFNDKLRIENYFESKYQKPHGVRHIKFQIETYKGKMFFPYIPYIKIVNGEQEDKKLVKSIKNIYYTSWNWDLYYSENRESIIRLGINENEK